MPTPKPRQRVRGSATGRPIMVLLDLLGRRMALRILWELRDERRLTFRALQEAAETNPERAQRAAQGAARGAARRARATAGYGLTPQGKELLETFLPLHAWAEKWAAGVPSRSGARSPVHRCRAVSAFVACAALSRCFPRRWLDTGGRAPV